MLKLNVTHTRVWKRDHNNSTIRLEKSVPRIRELNAPVSSLWQCLIINSILPF